MKLGIYGGTFNPPHTGHLTAARSALEALELDRLVLLPAAQPPHITEGEVRRAADQIYKIIEERLRRELRRGGR